jgi:hypothetical protein
MPQESVQYFLALAARRAYQKIAGVARAPSVRRTKRLNLRAFERGPDKPAGAL